METKTIEKKKKKDNVKEKVKEQIKDEFLLQDDKLKLKIECEKSVLKSLIDKIGGLNDEISLSVTKQGFNVRQVDVSQVAMVDMTIKKLAFDSYRVSHECKFGMNLITLGKHLKAHGTDITIENGTNQLLFKGESGLQNKMGLLPVLDTEVKIPNIKYSVEAKVKARNIRKMIDVASDFGSDALKFIIQDNQFIILVDIDTDQVRFPICSVNRLDDSKGNFESLYSVDYLQLVTNFDDSDTIFVRFGKDIPINFEFEDSKRKYWYLLAPRIESDDSE